MAGVGAADTSPVRVPDSFINKLKMKSYNRAPNQSGSHTEII